MSDDAPMFEGIERMTVHDLDEGHCQRCNRDMRFTGAYGMGDMTTGEVALGVKDATNGPVWASPSYAASENVPLTSCADDAAWPPEVRPLVRRGDNEFVMPIPGAWEDGDMIVKWVRT